MGKWQADKLKLELTAEGEGVWHLCAHVANTMNCKVSKAGDGFSAGMVASTRMLPPPDLQEREREVGNLLANLKSISVEGGQLKISSDSFSLLLDPAQEKNKGRPHFQQDHKSFLSQCLCRDVNQRKV